MRTLLYIVFGTAFLNLCAPHALADSIGQPIWATRKEFKELNQGMRSRADKSTQEADEFRKKWEAEEPAREARRKDAELRAYMDRKQHGSLSISASSVPSGAIIDACVEKYRRVLKDPNSVYVVSSTFTASDLIVDARAKNSFGGYIPAYFKCAMLGSDRLDDEKTDIYVALFSLGVRN